MRAAVLILLPDPFNNGGVKKEIVVIGADLPDLRSLTMSPEYAIHIFQTRQGGGRGIMGIERDEDQLVKFFFRQDIRSHWMGIAHDRENRFAGPLLQF